MNGEFIILNDQKKATHKFIDGGKSWDEVKDFDNIARIVPNPFIVLDFDTKSDAEIMLRIIEGEDLKCKVMKTDRGIHCYFKSVEPWKCFKKERLACGIYSDCKSHSKHAYTVIRRNGEDREWIRDCPDDEVMDVPPYLIPVKVGNMFSFKEMGDGDGRNQELFNYILTLQQKGLKKDEVIETLRIINEYVFKDSLPDSELRTICREDAFMSDDEVEQQQIITGKFNHAQFARYLMSKEHIIFYHDAFYIYDGGYYKQGIKTIRRKMVELFDGITKHQKAEVIDYLATQCDVDEVKTDKYNINLENCRLNVMTGEITDHDPRYMDFNRIPVKYDPNAKCEVVDQIIDKVFCGDKELVLLFHEMLGSCLMKHNKYQKAFILVGSGSNGKSTILEMIMSWIGKGNYSTLDITEMTTDKFAPVTLENKMVNIGDDCNDSMLKNTGTLKKIFAGQEIRVQHKGQDAFNIVPYATHIYSANELFKSKDKTDGFYRRLIFLPMMATFSSSDKDFDPMIESKVTTDEAKSHILNLALAGAKRLIRDGRFIEPESVVKMLERYKIDNTISFQYIEDSGIDENHCLTTPIRDLYMEFTEWCESSGVNPVSARLFYKDIQKYFGFANEKKRTDGGKKRYFMMDLEV